MYFLKQLKEHASPINISIKSIKASGPFKYI